ncbi:MAG: hypothetical protein NVS1B4_07780 [Gemmatimonadaceae bacterium]
MSNVAKLKKKATEFEQKKQFDKALSVYQQILAEVAGVEEEGDVTLYNRVGDLLLRRGSVAEALEHYERAVDLYADGGFFNNAIALCNKILRQSPGRTSIYYKLGKISAKKGFKSDAKQNFLEYADRMQRAGQIDEAFRALKEFADLCPDQDDIRLMLAEQLSKKERNAEALEQLQTLYEKLEVEGRATEARATLDRMKAIDPDVAPKAPGQQPSQKTGDLVFLDVDYDTPAPGPAKADRLPEAPSRKRDETALPPESARNGPGVLGSEFYVPPELESPAAAEGQGFAPSPPHDLTASGGDVSGIEFGSSLATDSLGLDYPPSAAETPGLRDPRDPGTGHGIVDFETTAFQTGSAESLLDATSSLRPLVDIELATEEHEPAPPAEHDLSLPGELPMLGAPGSAENGAVVNWQGEGGQPVDADLLGSANGSTGLESGAADTDFFLEIDQTSGLLDVSAGNAVGGLLDEGIPLIELEDRPDVGTAQPPRPEPPAPDKVTVPAAREQRVVPAPADVPLPVQDPTSPPSGVDALRAAVQRDAGNADLRRRFAESLLEGGAREEGLHELEASMISFERLGNLEAASSVADEIIRLNPGSVRHHQKRVEYAFRTNDSARLANAYLELADALFRGAQPEKAKAIYQRVLELAPDDSRAKTALASFLPVDTLPPPAIGPRDSKSADTGRFRRYTAEPRRTAPAPSPPTDRTRPTAPVSDSFVNLGDWLRDDQGPKSTRMIVEEQTPTGDEAADFAEMLRRFKHGVAENVDDEDHQSHYDLGVAYKEMGLLDEAIAEFQKTLRGRDHRVRSYEALGQCFLERSQFEVARSLLSRALEEPGHADDELVGVLYLTGYASEGLRLWDDALRFYQRVFAVDIQFRDIGERIAALERVMR